MVARPGDEYGSYGSVPSVEAQGGGASLQTEHATPESFGGQVGQAVENAGKQAQDLTQKYAGMWSENAAVTADMQFAEKAGNLKADLYSKTGAAAKVAYPQYQKDLETAYQEAGSGLPLAAQHAFAMTAKRALASHITDGASYVATQAKDALRYTYSDLANQNMQAILSPDVAHNDERFDYHLDTIRYAAQAQLDHEHPGLTTNPSTGELTFNEETPEGKQLKAGYEQKLDDYLSQANINRYSTLAKTNVFSAYDKYQQNRDNIPVGGKATLDAMFNQKLVTAHADHGSNLILQDAHRSQMEILAHPDLATAIHFQESGGKPHDYQIQPNTFKEYAKPGEDFNNPADQDKVYGRMINDLKKSYPNDTARQAVAYFSGKGNVAPAGSPTPWLHDYSDNTGKTVSSYVSDIENRMGEKPYATNPNGGLYTLADYYRTHSTQILAQGDAYAERTMPGDLSLKRAVRETLLGQMSRVISNEHAQYTLDNKTVMRAINGDFTQGKKPGSEQDLRAIPGMADLLDKVATQDPRFYKEIPGLVNNSSYNNKDAKEYGTGFYKLFQAIHAPDNDPNKVTRVSQLFSHIGENGDLTIAGYDKLTKEIEGSNSPEGNAESRMRAQTFKIVKSMVSGADEDLSIPDPQGERIYAHAMPLIYKAIEEGKKNGIPPSELYDPDNKNWVGNVAKGLVRSPAQWTGDLINASFNRSLSDIVKDVNDKKITPEQGKAEALKLGLIRADAAQPQGPQVPRPE